MKNRVVASLLCVMITSAMVISGTSSLEAQNDVVQVNVQGEVQTQGMTEKEKEEVEARARAEVEAKAQETGDINVTEEAETEVKASETEVSKPEGNNKESQQNDLKESAVKPEVIEEQPEEEQADAEQPEEVPQPDAVDESTEKDVPADTPEDSSEDVDTNPADEEVADDGIEENLPPVNTLPEKNIVENPEVESDQNSKQQKENTNASSVPNESTYDFFHNGFADNSLVLQIGQLKNEYHISFSSEFASIMEEIEKDYQQKMNLDSSLKATNWQDIIAVYAMQQNRRGITDVMFNENSKLELAKIFAEMNVPMMVGNEIHYSGDTVQTYIEKHENEISSINKKELAEYTSDDCALLCAASTSADPLVLDAMGTAVQGNREGVVKKAYDLVGKVSYFWGGKSSVIGWDTRWGNNEAVTASGSKSSGSIRSYGLDCSGYVAWVFANAYGNGKAISYVGQSTQEQWALSDPISAGQAQAGDLVFLKTPGSGGINHVGILVGQKTNGEWLVSHCSSSRNGVVITTANGVGFRYVRRPKIYSM